VLDERQDVGSQSAAQLTSTLSETHKFNLFAVLSHQTLGQGHERMRSGLLNVEVDNTVRTGRDDATHQERSHPSFFPCRSSGRAGRGS
jgi:hypothetical protein